MEEKFCHRLLEHLSDYLDHKATAAICAEIEEHMQGCEDCRVVIDTLRQTIDLYLDLPKPEMPQRLRDKVYKALDEIMPQ